MKHGHLIGGEAPPRAGTAAAHVRMGATYRPIRQTWQPALQPTGLRGAGLAAVYSRKPPPDARNQWLWQMADDHPDWIAFDIPGTKRTVLLPPGELMKEI